MILHKILILIFSAALSQSIAALANQMPMPVVGEEGGKDIPIELNPPTSDSLIPADIQKPTATKQPDLISIPQDNPPEVIEEEKPISMVSGFKKTQKTPAQLPPIEPSDKKPDIYLNFENTTLTSVVSYMAELRNINLLPDKTLSDIKVSLTIREPLTIDGAWKIFLTLLEVSGFSIVEVDGLHKVMPKDKKLTEALPSYINVPYTTLPESDLTIRYVMFLQNLHVESVKDLLDSLLSDKHTLFPYTQANCFIITDRCYNIKSAMKIIQELDTMGQPETVVVMRLKRTNASDVKGLLDGLMKKNDNNPLARLFAKSSDTSTDYFPAGTKIVAEDRTNSLILMGSPDPIKKIENFIVEYIDVELKTAESPLHIYELQYADATQIAEILKEVTAAPEQGPGQQAAKYGAVRGGVKYFKSLKFQVDKEANRLIISCTDKNDWGMLKGIIKDLDKPQPQVAIETMFVSITASDLDQMGGSMRNPSPNTLGGKINFQSANLANADLSESQNGSDPTTLLGNMLKQLIPSAGSTLLSFGKKTNIWAVFEMLRTRTNATVLSQPFITVANKVTGKITVGEERNVLLQDTGSGGIKGYGPINADTSVEIEPQINTDGVVRLKINVSISEFLNAIVSDKSTKHINTNVTMADGQVLVLGGFIQTKVGESISRTPLLSNIPLLGWFFKNQQRTVSRTYIFIFMAPTIVKPRTIPGVELYTKMKMHSATNNIENSISTIKSSDPLFNWFFDPKKESYSHKVIDFANARYQPTTVDIKHDPYYRNHTTNNDEDTSIHQQPVFPHAPTVISNEPINKIETSIAVAPKNTIDEVQVLNQHVIEKKQTEGETSDQIIPVQIVEDAQKSLIKPDKLTLQALQQSKQSFTAELIQGEQSAADISRAEVDSHPAKQDVLSMLNNRMQEKRLANIDDNHLANQRKKLKNLISQTYNTEPTTKATNQASKQQSLKSLLDIPTPKSQPEKGLVIDPAKRNSLKDFLLHTEPLTSAARNNKI